MNITLQLLNGEEMAAAFGEMGRAAGPVARKAIKPAMALIAAAVRARAPATASRRG